MEDLAEKLRQALGPLPGWQASPQPVRLATPDARQFWAGFLSGLEGGGGIILMDPAWPADWKTRLESLLEAESKELVSQILIPTSGSSGLPRFCVHNLETLWAAASAFAKRFGEAGIHHAVNILPQHHVGGLMPVFRSAACGGRVHFADYRSTDSFRQAPFPLNQASLSLVPTQLGRMLEDPALSGLLQEFGLILLGGAGCPPGLLAAARDKGLRLAPCYGSTETAAMVTVLDPEAFLSGINGVGTALPHARIGIETTGRILIHSTSNLMAYRPATEGFCREPLRTGDLGQVDSEGRLFIHGRADRVILTGGENVHPEQVEATALASGLVADAWCHGEADADWGNRVVLAVVPGQSGYREDQLRQYLQEHLPRYAMPKSIRASDRIPRNDLGKIRNTRPEV